MPASCKEALLILLASPPVAPALPAASQGFCLITYLPVSYCLCVQSVQYQDSLIYPHSSGAQLCLFLFSLSPGNSWFHSQDSLWTAESTQRKEHVFNPKPGFQLCEGSSEMFECQGCIILFKNTSEILPWPLALNRDKAISSFRYFKITHLFSGVLFFFSLASLSSWKLLLPQFLTIKSSCTP